MKDADWRVTHWSRREGDEPYEDHLLGTVGKGEKERERKKWLVRYITMHSSREILKYMILF